MSILLQNLSVIFQSPISTVFGLVAIVALLLYLLEYNKRKKLEVAGEKYLMDVKQKGLENLNQSIKKSEDILSQAEIESVKVVAGSKEEISRLEELYSRKLAESIHGSEQNVNSAQAEFLKFMQDLQKRSAEFEEASKKAGEQRINQLFDRVEQTLSDFLVQTEQKTTSSIELELRAARQLVDTYKNQQLKLIDENIIAMMEQTLSIVLAKKLSLKDQLDLVYEALERAKVEKFIV